MIGKILRPTVELRPLRLQIGLFIGQLARATRTLPQALDLLLEPAGLLLFLLDRGARLREFGVERRLLLHPLVSGGFRLRVRGLEVPEAFRHLFPCRFEIFLQGVRPMGLGFELGVRLRDLGLHADLEPLARLLGGLSGVAGGLDLLVAFREFAVSSL